MKSLLIIESPLQLLNAYEAIFNFDISDGILLIRYSGFKQNDRQIDDILEKVKSPNNVQVRSVLIRVADRNLLDYGKAFLQKLKLGVEKFETIYVGNYDSPFIKLVIGKKKNLILLDDGSRTISAQQKFSNKHHFDWFTFFDLVPFKGQKIYSNKFEYIQKRIQKSDSSEKKPIIFIGANLSEDEIISEEYNIDLIKKIAKRYSDYNLLYVPHRSENQSKLKVISSIENIVLKHLDFPIELLPVYDYPIPSQIISFYSTALFTLGKIYGVPSTAFRFNYRKSEYMDHIDSVYDYFEQYMSVIAENDI
ncbi:hypothetical protein KFE94_04205 [bacterium SCSIO 12643]|nr:hypothetical protein KFE94_04205 [bacterium SCSIO 12643]